MKPLFYLEYRQIVNYLRMTARTPKRMIPGVLVFVWVVQALWLQSVGAYNHGNRISLLRWVSPDVLWTVGFLGLTAITIFVLIRSLSENPVIFSPAEMDFLFPSPSSRRSVMLLKFIKLHIRLGIYLAFVMLFMLPMLGLPVLASSNPLRSMLGWVGAWVFSALLLHLCALINYSTTYRDTGRRLDLAVRAVAWGIPVLLIIGVLINFHRTSDLASSLRDTAAHPAALLIMFPIKSTADLIFSPFLGWQPGYGNELAVLMILAGLSFIGVMLCRRNTYEPSLMVSTRHAAVRAAMNTGGFSRARMELLKWQRRRRSVQPAVPFFGRGVMAVFWKNLNLTIRVLGGQYLLVAVLIVSAFVVMRLFLPHMVSADVVRACTLGGLMYIVLLVPVAMLQNLRLDMQRANTLRPMPIRPWKLMVVETLHGTLFMSLLTWLIIGTVSVLYGLPDGHPLIALAFVIPFLAHNALCAQIAVSTVYPNWDDSYQKFVGSMFSFTAAMMALTPPLTVGLVFWYMNLGTVAMVVFTSAACLGVSVGGIALGAWAYRKHDPSDM